MGELDAIAEALALNPLPTVPSHNDLAPYNFLDDGDRLWIIDFEFSGNNDPFLPRHDCRGSRARCEPPPATLRGVLR